MYDVSTLELGSENPCPNVVYVPVGVGLDVNHGPHK